MLKGMAFSPVRVMRVEEESPYKPEEFIPGLIWLIAHTFSHTKLHKVQEKNRPISRRL